MILQLEHDAFINIWDSERVGCIPLTFRPVKRDWAVLSKDTPVDISIWKSVWQGAFIHLWNALQLYTCIYLLLFWAHFEKKASRINLDNKETD